MYEIIFLACPIYLVDGLLSGIYGAELLRPRLPRRITLLVWTVFYFFADILIYEILSIEGNIAGVMVNLLVMCLAQFIFFKIDLKRQIIVSFSFVAGRYLLKYIISIIYDFISKFTWTAVSKWLSEDISMTAEKAEVAINANLIFLGVVCAAAYFLVFWVYLKLVSQKYIYRDYDPSVPEMAFLIFPCAAALCISVTLRMLIVRIDNGMTSLVYDTVPSTRLWVAIICLMLLASIVLSVVLFQYLIERNEENKKQMILENQLEQIHREITEVEGIYSDLRSLKHDMRNHLNSIVQYVQECSVMDLKDIGEYVGKLENSVNKLDFPSRSGNAITDIIIFQRQQEAEKSGIIFESDFVLPKESVIDVYDVAIILNNALDNAFEACSKVNGSREIELHSYMKGTLFFIEIVNDFEESIVFDKETGLPRTTKDDKRMHGIGLQNIRKCAVKYMGDVDIAMTSDDRRKRFVLTVMMGNRISLQ